ncbi:MAG: response regulator [Proteobacteria bacterium]|nr:response regulator [Burkholderiales bacterium]
MNVVPASSSVAPRAERATILVIDDEAPIRRFVRASLHANGFVVIEADRGERGLLDAANRAPDLMILDLGLPDIDGLVVVKRLREWSAMPVIVLSARTGERDKIDALDAGADDYLTKPFGTGEMLARVRVALRHRARTAQDTPQTSLNFGEVVIDLAARRVTRAGTPVHLTPTEYRLMAELARHGGKVLTHRHLLREVWGPARIEQNHYLRIYMAELRRKLEVDPARPQYLMTEQGVGYRLEVE